MRTELSIIFCLFIYTLSPAQEQTVGLFTNDSSASKGYLLYAPMQYLNTYLLDNCGQVINEWES